MNRHWKTGFKQVSSAEPHRGRLVQLLFPPAVAQASRSNGRPRPRLISSLIKRPNRPNNLYTQNFKRLFDLCCAQVHTCTHTVRTQTHPNILRHGNRPGARYQLCWAMSILSSVSYRMSFIFIYLWYSPQDGCEQPLWFTSLPGPRAVGFGPSSIKQCPLLINDVGLEPPTGIIDIALKKGQY